MKNFVFAVSLVALSSLSYAEEKQFFYFAKTVDGEFKYTRILRCDPSSVNPSDTSFGASDAVGPFDEFSAVSTHWENAIIQVQKQGKKIQLSESVCLGSQ